MRFNGSALVRDYLRARHGPSRSAAWLYRWLRSASSVLPAPLLPQRLRMWLDEIDDRAREQEQRMIRQQRANQSISDKTDEARDALLRAYFANGRVHSEQHSGFNEIPPALPISEYLGDLGLDEHLLSGEETQLDAAVSAVITQGLSPPDLRAFEMYRKGCALMHGPYPDYFLLCCCGCCCYCQYW